MQRDRCDSGEQSLRLEDSRQLARFHCEGKGNGKSHNFGCIWLVWLSHGPRATFKSTSCQGAGCTCFCGGLWHCRLAPLQDLVCGPTGRQWGWREATRVRASPPKSFHEAPRRQALAQGASCHGGSGLARGPCLPNSDLSPDAEEGSGDTGHTLALLQLPPEPAGAPGWRQDGSSQGLDSWGSLSGAQAPGAGVMGEDTAACPLLWALGPSRRQACPQGLRADTR